MKKKLAILAGSLTLTLCGLVMVLSARPVLKDGEKEEAPPKAANSKIVAVTVYPNSALITRDVDVPAGAGVVELIVTPLPQHTINSSLYSEGSDAIRVLSTRFRMRPVREDTREDVRKSEEAMKILQRKGQALQAEVEAQKQNMALYAEPVVVDQYRKQLGKLNCGKSCIRFRHLDDLPLDVVEKILRDTVALRKKGVPPSC